MFCFKFIEKKINLNLSKNLVLLENKFNENFFKFQKTSKKGKTQQKKCRCAQKSCKQNSEQLCDKNIEQAIIVVVIVVYNVSCKQWHT